MYISYTCKYFSVEKWDWRLQRKGDVRTEPPAVFRHKEYIYIEMI